MRTLTFAALVLAGACVSMKAAPQASQRSFATPQDAAHALADAAEANDTAALVKILGPEGKDIVSSGDATEDKSGRAQFARMAAEKLQIRQDEADRNTIVAGSQEWPFPVPLVRGKDGMWRFDSSAGRVEVLARRIGHHELNAIEVCRGYVEAQMEFATRHNDGTAGCNTPRRSPARRASRTVCTGRGIATLWFPSPSPPRPLPCSRKARSRFRTMVTTSTS